MCVAMACVIPRFYRNFIRFGNEFFTAVTLFRRLWAYRQPVLRGDPHADLELTWTAVKRLVPDWIGFTPNRCSPGHGQIDVQAAAEALEKFDREIQKYDS